MVLRNFEDRLERLVEGIFARAFKSGLQPVEIGRRLVKQLDGNKALDVRGRPIGPNRFTVHLAVADAERFAQIDASLRAELVAIVRKHAQQEELLFLGRVAVDFEVDSTQVVGMFRIDAGFDDSVAEGSAPAHLLLPDGTQIALPDAVATLGRLPESTFVLSDPNASRRHAELHPDGDSYALVDLGSTNGSRVNGHRVDRVLLADGDRLTFGTITVTFRLL